MKNLIKTSIVTLSLVVSSVTMADGLTRENWEFIQDTTPHVYGFTYNARCEDLADKAKNIHTLLGIGMHPQNVYDMAYSFEAKPNWGEGLLLLIGAAHLFQTPSEYANYIGISCVNAR